MRVHRTKEMINHVLLHRVCHLFSAGCYRVSDDDYDDERKFVQYAVRKLKEKRDSAAWQRRCRALRTSASPTLLSD